MLVKLDWLNALGDCFSKPYYHKLYDKVVSDMYNGRSIELTDDIHSAFNAVPFMEVKVVIVGSAPSTPKSERSPILFNVSNGELSPSSKNFRQEIKDEYGEHVIIPDSLSYLTEQGVLLINASLTGNMNDRFAHMKLWEPFMKDAIRAIYQRPVPCVFVFLGTMAQRLAEGLTSVDNKKVICLPHPSPLSAYRGFIGSNVFKDINSFLVECLSVPINWYK